MISQRVSIIHGWRQCSVGCQAFSGTLWGRRALHRTLWAAAAGRRASQSHAGLRQRAPRPSAPWRTALGPLLVGLLIGALPAWAQFVEPPNPLGSLKTVPTPEPANLNQFLKSDGQGRIFPAARAAAIALGKALFWDQAAGSDGQACASCHFNAGADSRTRNQLNPGFRAIPSQTQFGAMPPQQTTGTTPAFTADYHLRASDFPFTQFIDQTDRTSGIVSDTQAVASSQGVFNSDFSDITPTLCPPDQPFLGTICDKAPANPAGNGAILPDRCAADAGAECGFRQREQADNNSSM